MGHDSLLELAQDRDVRRAAAFREVARSLDAETLARLYRRQKETAPQRSAAGKTTLGGRDGRLPKRGARRPEDQLAAALVGYGRATGQALRIPPRLHGDDAGSLTVLDYHVPLRLQASELPGAGHVDAIGVGPGDRLAVLVLRWIPPSASRGATGDTPLRALLEGLALCAVLEANAEAIRSEAAAAFGCRLADAPPLLFLIGSSRFWELSRRREAQRGAAWIQQMERLARLVELGDAGAAPESETRNSAGAAALETPSGASDKLGGDRLGIGVRYLALEIEGDPAWKLEDDRPVLVAPPRLAPAWESTAGRLKAKPRPRAKPQPVEPGLVEPDLSRPVRSYSARESFAAGDRIEHPTLGLGVVQGATGTSKIEVLFGDVRRILVHARA